MVKAKNKRISLIVQEGTLKSIFPSSEVRRNRENSLIWTYTLTPTPLSDDYKVKLHYCVNKGVDFYVLEPKLSLAPGHTTLPHVYSTMEQKLCLHYPKKQEWNNSMLYTKTIIPWACEWLYHYEIWVATGEWHGGGVAHDGEIAKESVSASS